jgi:SAM-dependent methyltransferase
MENIHRPTVSNFGDEWSRFNQEALSDTESKKIFDEYFSIFPWYILPTDAEGFDMGCGTGRWAKWVAPKVKKLHCIDPSEAIHIAKKGLSIFPNIEFHKASLEDNTLHEGSQDFGYSLGVLHHVPDTELALASCVKLLKKGSPILLYLYYAFDNRPFWFQLIWRLSDFVRIGVSGLPKSIKNIITDLLAIFIYWPLAKFSKLMELLHLPIPLLPLNYYRNHSFYTMRTDARDRFGTPLEQRFSKNQIYEMMERAGLEHITFSDKPPYWCSLGFKK